ncbi:MAG: hypothetical protein ACXQS8_06550 [Candidatus Helarchaeales archaeon]
MEEVIKRELLEIAEDFGTTLEEVEKEFNTQLKNFEFLVDGLGKERVVKKALVATCDAFCMRRTEAPSGSTFEGFFVAVLPPNDDNGFKINQIMDQCKTEKGKKAALEKGMITIDDDGSIIPIDTMKTYPGTSIENPHYGQPLLPAWSFRCYGICSIDGKQEAKYCELKFKDKHADPASPMSLYKTIVQNTWKPLKITQVYVNKNKTTDKMYYLTVGKEATVEVMDEGAEELPARFVRLQVQQETVPSYKFTTLNDVEAWYEQFGKRINARGEERSKWGEWCIVGFPLMMQEDYFLRVVDMRISEDPKQSSRIVVRDGSLERKRGSFKTLIVPSDIPIKFSRGSYIMAACQLYRSNTVYDPETGNYVEGKGDVQLRVLSIGVVLNTAPKEKPKEATKEEVSLDDL